MLSLQMLFTGVDLVEDAAVFKVRLLSVGPAAEYLVDGEEGEGGKAARVFLRHFRQLRTVVVARGDVLRGRTIQETQISFRDRPGAACIDDAVDHRHFGLCQYAC